MAQIKILAKKPEVPERPPPIYLLKTPHVTLSSLDRSARGFKLKADEEHGRYTIDSDSLTYSEGPFDLKLNRNSGALRFRDRARWQADDGKSNLDLSDERAVEVARRHIRAFKLEPADEFRLQKVTHLHVGTSDSKGEHRDERVIDAGVVFQRVIRGIPVDGPGGKMVAYIGSDGKITGIERIWRDIARVHRQVKSLRTAESALEDLERRWPADAQGTVEVNEFRFGYFELGWQDSQQYLQPAYVLLLRLVSPDKRFSRRSVWVVPAAVGAVGGLEPPKPKHGIVQPRREGTVSSARDYPFR